MSVSNETRAAALKYDGGKAPIVVASGAGYLGEKILDIASQHNVPIYQDNSLAMLLSQLDAGSEIPQELYQAIVDIYVYFLNYKDNDNLAEKNQIKVNEEQNIEDNAEEQINDNNIQEEQK